MSPGQNFIQVVGLSCGKKGSGTARIEISDENKVIVAGVTFYFNHPSPPSSIFENGEYGYVKKEKRERKTYILQNNHISNGG